MRPLIIEDSDRKAIVKVVEFAMKPENWYRSDVAGVVPGDNPNYVVHNRFGFRSVFTFTLRHEVLYRHLTVSVAASDPQRRPHPIAVMELARLFGFTGVDEDKPETYKIEHLMRDHGWMFSDGHEGARCIVVIQEIKDTHYTGPVPPMPDQETA